MPLKTIYINLRGRIIEKIIGGVATENNFTDEEKAKLANVGELTPEQLDAIINAVLEEIEIPEGMTQSQIFNIQ
jgi:hypothetical protein